MSKVQPIIHQGRVTAVVIAGEAIIPDALPSQERATVKAMCLYAIEVADGRLPGPYSDAQALAYAHMAAAKRNEARLRCSTLPQFSRRP